MLAENKKSHVKISNRAPAKKKNNTCADLLLERQHKCHFKIPFHFFKMEKSSDFKQDVTIL
jgi:hypothetical protein